MKCETPALCRLVARSSTDPQAERDRAHAGDVLADDALAAGERRQPVRGHGADRSRRQRTCPARLSTWLLLGDDVAREVLDDVPPSSGGSHLPMGLSHRVRVRRPRSLRRDGEQHMWRRGQKVMPLSSIGAVGGSTGVFVKRTWRWWDSPSKPANGWARTSSSRSLRVRTITSTLFRPEAASASSSVAEMVAGFCRRASSTTLPDCRCVRTSVKPSSSTSERRSAMRIRLRDARLMARRNAA